MADNRSILEKLLAVTATEAKPKAKSDLVFGSWRVATYEGTNKRTGKPYFGVNLFPDALANSRQKPSVEMVQAIVSASLTDAENLTAAIKKALEIMADHDEETDDDDDTPPETTEERKRRLAEQMGSRKK